MTLQQQKLTTKTLVALYCGSRMGNKELYRHAAIELAQAIAKRNMGIVYGGASIGLMGQVANAVLELDGEVLGVIPEFMLEFEVAHNSLTELQVVDSMHTRKAIMADRASAFVALPGGIGTFEEILEVATWAQLNQHHKPMILYNVNQYYAHLIAQLDHALNEGFLPQDSRANILSIDNLDDLFLVLDGLNTPKNIVT